MDWETQTVFALAAVFAAVGYVLFAVRRALCKQEGSTCGGCAECPNASAELAQGAPQGIELISIESTRAPVNGASESSRFAG